MKVLFKKVIALKCNLQFAICSKIKLSAFYLLNSLTFYNSVNPEQ